MSLEAHTSVAPLAPLGARRTDVPFGVNEIRLSARQWVVTIFIVGVVVLVGPRLWEGFERFQPGPDYRIPYSLSRDYWLYERRLRQAPEADGIPVLGDSVVWGEYVSPDGTLTHFLNQSSGGGARFINAGMNGLFPLALEGLVECYARPVRHRRVVLHANALWMTSPKADLSTRKEESFNHASLVPQFAPRLPYYKADVSTRLNAVIERNVDFLGWINHLQVACFSQKSIPSWTLADDGGDPPRYPNTWRNPLAQLRVESPGATDDDPQRGPSSPRHKPWSRDGKPTTRFDWVPLDHSLQWQALQRLIRRLRERGNDVLVILGPFNETMLLEDNRLAYRNLRAGIARWLEQEKIPHVLPEPLPSDLYADASHPLTEGYQLLAQRLNADPTFQAWASGRSGGTLR